MAITRPRLVALSALVLATPVAAGCGGTEGASSGVQTVTRTVTEAQESTDTSGNVVRSTDLKRPKRLELQVATGSQGQALALVKVRIGGQGPFRFILDTGASTTAIDARLASRLGLDPEGQAAPIQGVAGVGAGQPVRVSRWRIDTLRMRSRRIVAINLPDADRGNGIEGLIGSDVLSDFSAVGLDYAKGRLTIGPLRKR